MRHLLGIFWLTAMLNVGIAQARCPTLADVTWTPDPALDGEDVVFRLFITNALYTMGQIKVTGYEIHLNTRTNPNFATLPPFHLTFLTAPNLLAGTYRVSWDNLREIGGPSGVQCPRLEWDLIVEGLPPPAPVAVPVPVGGLSGPLVLLLLLTTGLWAKRYGTKLRR